MGLLAQAEPSISESSRRGQNESHPLSLLEHRQFRSVFFFFFRESPWPNFVEFGTFKKPPGGNTHTMLWPTDKHDICSSFNLKRTDRVLLP